MYEHVIKSKTPWDYPQVEKEPNGRYLTHNILKSMSLLEPIKNHRDVKGPTFKAFEEDPEITLQQYEARDQIRQKLQAIERHMSSSPALYTDSRRFAPYPGTSIGSGRMSASAPNSRPHSSASTHASSHASMPNRSNQPNHIQIPPHTPIGGQLPDTPDESPGRGEQKSLFGRDFVRNQMSALEQPAIEPYRQNLVGVTQAPSMHTQAYGSLPGQHFHEFTTPSSPAPYFHQFTPIHHLTDPNPFLQEPTLSAATPFMHLSHQGGANSDPNGFTHAPFPLGQQSPVSPLLGHHETEGMWLATATDPVMGSTPSDPGLSEEMDVMDCNAV